MMISTHRFTLAWWTQVSVLLLTISPSSTTSAKLDSLAESAHRIADREDHQDSVLINFSRRTNTTKTARHLYLPPEEQEFFLPEVIDNRVRNSPAIFRPALPVAGASVFATPDIELRTPLTNGENPGRYANRQYIGRTKIPITPVPVALSAAKNDPVPKELTTGYVRVNSMSCQNSGEELFFRASMTPPRHSEFPVIEGVVGDNCRMERINDEYRIDFTNEFFWNCGIRDCSTDSDTFYCLNMRFPAIAGLRLKEDFKVTLRCKTQDKTVSHTRRINVKTLDTSGRNSPRIETGGYKNTFETEVGLYRKTFGTGQMFDAKIQPGGTVILGEEILLRAVVREGDDFNTIDKCLEFSLISLELMRSEHHSQGLPQACKIIGINKEDQESQFVNPEPALLIGSVSNGGGSRLCQRYPCHKPGWRYSRISDVTVHYVEKKRRSKIMNSLWILNADGCLNPEVREICSREQYRVSPLENYLMFEAFMFDNMKETDEMVMNVKITGCVDGADCALNCPAGHSRRVRSTEESPKNHTVDWADDITFRVVLPQAKAATAATGKSLNSHLALPYILSALVLVTIAALLVTIKRRSASRI